MEEVIPLFKSHYSLGRSILTLDMPKEFTDDRSDTVFDIVDDITPEIKDVFLVEDSMAGFLEAYTNAKELKKKLIFGLRLTFCPDCLEKNEEGRKNSFKNIIFIKNESGYKQLIKIFTHAAQDGFYYEPRLDFKTLKQLWTDDLILAIPFYDSFLYKNKYTNSQCIPDFSFTDPVFLIEDNDTLLDKGTAKAVEKFCEGKYKTFKSQSVYYRNNEDFEAYITARRINKRTTTEKPNLEGMCSDQFSIEAWCKKTGSKITGKPCRAIEEKEIIEAAQVISIPKTHKKQFCRDGNWIISRDENTPRGQASRILQLFTNRVIGELKNWDIKPTTKYEKHDGTIYSNGKVIRYCENKTRPFLTDYIPFLEEHLYEKISGNTGWLISEGKLKHGHELSKKEGKPFDAYLILPFDRKIFRVPICNAEGKFICTFTTDYTPTWENGNRTHKVKRANSFVDMTFFKKNPDAIIRYSDSQLLDDPIKIDPECVKLSTKFHTPITHMSEKQAHDNLLANEKWPWNWVEWTD